MKAIAETIKNGIVVAPKEPDDVLVQRQLQSWLDPGWCMAAPARSEPRVNRKRKLILWWVAGVLSLLVLVTSYPMGGLIAIALVLSIVIAVVRANSGATTIMIAEKENGRLSGGGRVSPIEPDDLARFEGEGGLKALDPDHAETQKALMRACKPRRPPSLTGFVPGSLNVAEHSEEVEEAGFEEVPILGAAGEEAAQPEVAAFDFVNIQNGEVTLGRRSPRFMT